MISELYDIADRINMAIIHATSPEDLVQRMKRISTELREEADETELQLAKELYDDRLYISSL